MENFKDHALFQEDYILSFNQNYFEQSSEQKLIKYGVFLSETEDGLFLFSPFEKKLISTEKDLLEAFVKIEEAKEYTNSLKQSVFSFLKEKYKEIIISEDEEISFFVKGNLFFLSLFHVFEEGKNNQLFFELNATCLDDNGETVQYDFFILNKNIEELKIDLLNKITSHINKHKLKNIFNNSYEDVIFYYYSKVLGIPITSLSYVYEETDLEETCLQRAAKNDFSFSMLEREKQRKIFLHSFLFPDSNEHKKDIIETTLQSLNLSKEILNLPQEKTIILANSLFNKLIDDSDLEILEDVFYFIFRLKDHCLIIEKGLYEKNLCEKENF